MYPPSAVMISFIGPRILRNIFVSRIYCRYRIWFFFFILLLTYFCSLWVFIVIATLNSRLYIIELPPVSFRFPINFLHHWYFSEFFYLRFSFYFSPSRCVFSLLWDLSIISVFFWQSSSHWRVIRYTIITFYFFFHYEIAYVKCVFHCRHTS